MNCPEFDTLPCSSKPCACCHCGDCAGDVRVLKDGSSMCFRHWFDMIEAQKMLCKNEMKLVLACKMYTAGEEGRDTSRSKTHTCSHSKNGSKKSASMSNGGGAAVPSHSRSKTHSSKQKSVKSASRECKSKANRSHASSKKGSAYHSDGTPRRSANQ